MAKGKSYQRYPAHFKRMALAKADEDGMTVDLAVPRNICLSRF